MRPKYLIFIIGTAIMLTSCRKMKDISPLPDETKPEVTAPILPVPVFSISNVLQSNMVVQRDKPFIIWGQATAGHSISVSVSWNKNAFTAVSDNSGNWRVSIPAAGASSAPQNITCSSKGTDDIVLDNILIGDVWLCSGQSNMVMPVDAVAPFTGVLNYQEEIDAASYPDMRLLTVYHRASAYPLYFLNDEATWDICTPQTARYLSAVAYYFARKLHTTLNVPVGIIISAVNGTSCEQWVNSNGFKNNPDIKAYSRQSNSSGYYNGMINPLINLSIKGFIWYQGENNKHNYPELYTKLNTALINGWRGIFNQGQLPFYFVQVAPFAEDYNATKPAGGNPTLDDYAKFREAQAGILTVPGTGMAVTMDVGEPDNHHPRDKKPVGERLALLALKNTYNQNVICYGPRYSFLSINNNRAIVNFAGSTADGLNTKADKPLNQLFYVAGADHAFKQAVATIQGNTVLITAPAGIPLPIQAVRYAFTNAAITNLQNAAGLPAEPFRSDNWDE